MDAHKLYYIILGSDIEYPTNIIFVILVQTPNVLAHLSRKLIGELIVYIGIRRLSTFSNDFSSEAVMPILFIFTK